MKILEKLFSKRQRFQYEGENAVLVQAMHELALKYNPENRKKMFELLLSSTLLIPTPELPAASGPGKESDGNITLPLVFISDRQGQKLTPAFTDIEALRNFDPNTPCLSVRARGFFEIISTSFSDIRAVVINPYDPSRKRIRPEGIITRSEFEVLARGLVPIAIAGGLAQSRVPTAGLQELIRPPNQPIPPAVSELLRKCAENIPEIVSLHFFWIAHTHGSPQPTVGVQLDRTVPEQRAQVIVQALWQSVAPSLIELKTLDFLALPGEITRAESTGDRIYQRL